MILLQKLKDNAKAKSAELIRARKALAQYPYGTEPYWEIFNRLQIIQEELINTRQEIKDIQIEQQIRIQTKTIERLAAFDQGFAKNVKLIDSSFDDLGGYIINNSTDLKGLLGELRKLQTSNHRMMNTMESLIASQNMTALPLGGIVSLLSEKPKPKLKPWLKKLLSFFYDFE